MREFTALQWLLPNVKTGGFVNDIGIAFSTKFGFQTPDDGLFLRACRIFFSLIVKALYLQS